MTTTVSEKGQITIPVELRKSLGLRKGSQLKLEERNGTIVMRKHFAVNPIESIMGILPPMDVDAFIRAARGPAWDAKLDPPRLAPERPHRRAKARSQRA